MKLKSFCIETCVIFNCVISYKEKKAKTLFTFSIKLHWLVEAHPPHIPRVTQRLRRWGRSQLHCRKTMIFFPLLSFLFLFFFIAHSCQTLLCCLSLLSFKAWISCNHFGVCTLMGKQKAGQLTTIKAKSHLVRYFGFAYMILSWWILLFV